MGVAERMNRTLLEKVRCMLSNASLSKKFWAEALAYACYLVNRLSSSAIGGRLLLKLGREKQLLTMICYGCSDVQPTIMSKMIS